MKIFFVFICLITISSCSLKEAIENDFETTTSVDPIAPSKTLAERFGNGENLKFTIKIPLTEDSIGYYDIEDVLGNRNLNSKIKTWKQRLYDTFKLKLYNFFVSLGYSNKLKFSSVFNFPQIDSRFIKSAKVKKIFFTTEDCRPEEDNCNDRSSLGSNFNLVDTFFVNISSVKKSEPESSNMTELTSDEFEKATKHAFTQTRDARIKNSHKNAETTATEEDRIINLVKFSNNIPFIDTKSVEIIGDSKFRLNVESNHKAIAKYLKGNQFSHLISRVRHGYKRKKFKQPFRKKIKGILISLNEGATANDVINIIDSDHSPYAKKMFIFRLEGNYIEAKKYFARDEFKGIVKDTTMIGRSLYVEVESEINILSFEKHLIEKKNSIDSHFKIYKVDRCELANCIDLKVNDINLVPLLERDPNIKIDTYLSVKTLGERDFKYNGFIEVEIILDVPI